MTCVKVKSANGGTFLTSAYVVGQGKIRNLARVDYNSEASFKFGLKYTQNTITNPSTIFASKNEKTVTYGYSQKPTDPNTKVNLQFSARILTESSKIAGCIRLSNFTVIDSTKHGGFSVGLFKPANCGGKSVDF